MSNVVQERHLHRVQKWCAINSGTRHAQGVRAVAESIAPELEAIASSVEFLPMPPVATIDDAGATTEFAIGPALRARCRPEAKIQALCVIHTDTVYGPESAFQTVTALDDAVHGGPALNGPGVADAKGGIAVLLGALELLEASPAAERDGVGWTVVLNPDEEIGSPSSRPLLQAEAASAHLGLVFEPTLPDGGVIAERKGSGNLVFVVRGKSAHAGRDFADGRNAVAALCDLFTQIHALNGQFGETTINLGKVTGGGPTNVVPDLAVGRLNLRAWQEAELTRAQAAIRGLATEVGKREGITVEVHGGAANPPLAMTPGRETMLDHLRAVFADHDQTMTTRSTGGVSDANKLAAVGLSALDGLGPRGGAIHSSDEFLLTDSLSERAVMVAELLRGYATGRFVVPARH